MKGCSKDIQDDFYRLMVEHAPDGMALLQEGTMQFANKRFEELSGYSLQEANTLSFLRFVHPDDRLKIQDYWSAKLEGKESSGDSSFRFVDKEGGETWVHMNAVVVTWNEGPAIVVFLRDMTWRYRAEARLVQAQKLEALGTMAEGIAHDFNNLLMSIQGYASLALMEGGLAKEVTGRIRKIQDLVQSGSELTTQLLGFSGTAHYEVVPINLNTIVSGAVFMAEHSNRAISFHRNLQSDLWAVKVDRGQIEQAVMSLLLNAVQAMPGGGDLYIETDNVILFHGEERCGLLGLEPGTYVRLSITDTGIGIDDAMIHRIFDPFFTTREGGSGLGLPSAYGVVRAHGGTIHVTSRTGQGSRFEVYMPAVDDQDSTPRRSAGERDRRDSGATILIVDDEKYVLDVNRELLELHGYKVLEAQSGREALEIYSRAKDEIDLVILDLIMPVMSGSETFDGLREIDPDVKVVLLSGYSVEGGARELLKKGCRAYIQKPFTIDHLTKQIQDVLDDRY